MLVQYPHLVVLRNRCLYCHSLQQVHIIDSSHAKEGDHKLLQCPAKIKDDFELEDRVGKAIYIYIKEESLNKNTFLKRGGEGNLRTIRLWSLESTHLI